MCCHHQQKQRLQQFANTNHAPTVTHRSSDGCRSNSRNPADSALIKKDMQRYVRKRSTPGPDREDHERYELHQQPHTHAKARTLNINYSNTPNDAHTHDHKRTHLFTHATTCRAGPIADVPQQHVVHSRVPSRIDERVPQGEVGAGAAEVRSGGGVGPGGVEAQRHRRCRGEVDRRAWLCSAWSQPTARRCDKV